MTDRAGPTGTYARSLRGNPELSRTAGPSPVVTSPARQVAAPSASKGKRFLKGSIDVQILSATKDL